MKCIYLIFTVTIFFFNIKGAENKRGRESVVPVDDARRHLLNPLILARRDGIPPRLPPMIIPHRFPQLSSDLAWWAFKAHEHPDFLKAFKKELGKTKAYEATDYKSRTCRTILMVVARKNQNLIKAILRYNPDLNRRDIRGNTALHHAIEGGTYSCVDLLVFQPDIDFTVENCDGLTPTALAEKLFSEYKQAADANKVPHSIACVEGSLCSRHRLERSDIWMKKNILQALTYDPYPVPPPKKEEPLTALTPTRVAL